MALLSTKGVYGLAAILQIAKASEVAYKRDRRAYGSF